MPRYEFTDGTSNKFWEIEVKGGTYTAKWGKIGGSTSMSTKDLGTPAAAKKAADKLIAEKLNKGYALAGNAAKKAKAAAPAVGSGRNKDLEKQIAANPDDPEPYLIYADWLQAQGDPRGELIALQHGKKTKQANALLAKQLGSFAETKPKMFELEWFCGHIRKAKIGWEDFDQGDGIDAESCGTRLIEFLRLPVAQFLQELVLGSVPGDEEMNTSSLSEAIEKVPPPCLHTLQLNYGGSWDISSTAAVLPESKSLKQLRKLELDGGNITLGKIDLPELRHFKVVSGGLTAVELKQLASANWPKLEHLEIYCGDPNYGASGGVKELAPIFAATGLGKLKYLGIKNCPFGDEVVAKLIKSKILPQLRTLDLSLGALSDSGVDAMVAARASFEHLALLDLDDNGLTDASKPKIKGLAKKVNWGTQDSPDRADPENRYVAIGE
jgi:uncharacterized protein (TIGR02996 family)